MEALKSFTIKDQIDGEGPDISASKGLIIALQGAVDPKGASSRGPKSLTGAAFSSSPPCPLW